MASTTTSPARFGLFNPLPDSFHTSRPRLSPAQETASTLVRDNLDLVAQLQVITEREGEDAAITGGTRSLHRRLLALNIQASSQVISVWPVRTKLSALPHSA